MSGFNMDFKDPTTWLLAPLLAPLLPLVLLSGCEEDDTDVVGSNDDNDEDDTNEATYIAAGSFHTCALLDSGDVKCWGDNDWAQLGDGTLEDKSTPVDVFGLTSDLQAISAGFHHTCAVLQSGGVMCWGGNWNGELGNGMSGTGEYETTPVDVVGLTSDLQAMSAGDSHTCVVLTSGGMKCWGYNGAGQLGNGISGNHEYETTPVDVSGLTSGVQAIAAGEEHTCALLTSGGVKCWGENQDGQLGDGTTADRTTPVDVSGLSSGVQDIAAGGLHTCALLTSGGVKCWGWNDAGQLGDETTEDKTTPVDVSGLSSGVQAIAAGGYHTCALLTSGGMKCWGYNGDGQLGNNISGEGEYETTPVDVSGLSSDIQGIAAGGWHTCALLDSGGVKCWGYNEHGQLGDGAKEGSSTPVDVAGF